MAIGGLGVKKRTNFTVGYKWTLVDMDGFRVKEGEGVYTQNKTDYLSTGKRDAIKIAGGSLKAFQAYQLYVSIIDGDVQSEREWVARFTIKDKDELYLQIVVVFIATALAVIGGILSSRMR